MCIPVIMIKKRKMHLFLLITLLYANFYVTVSKPGDISKKMCKKYGEAVYVQEPDLSMISSTGYNNVSECGLVSVPLIIGGEKAIGKEFPHFALIGFGANIEDELKWHCGGSLISERFVLSAAHCSVSPIGRALKVKLGMISLEEQNNNDDIKEEIIQKIINHPDYKRPIKYNDISLIRLKNAIQFTPYIRPACLNTKDIIKEKSAIAIGFGQTSFDDTELSKVLMKVTLNIFSYDKCKTFFPPLPVMVKGLVPSMICAGVLEGGKDTCQGDSGGPLQIILDDPYCMYSIIGITSFGTFCGFENSPAIYTKISHYIPWIESHVWKDKVDCLNR